MFLVPLFDLKFLTRACGKHCRNFRSAALAASFVEIGCMHIVCPHCTASYAIDLATLGTAGRTVRCSRCKEVWLARPDDAAEIKASALAMAEAGPEGATGEWNVLARQDDNGARQIPVVDSPSISADWPAEGEGSRVGRDWPSISRDDMEGAGAARQHHAWFQKLR